MSSLPFVHTGGRSKNPKKTQQLPQQENGKKWEQCSVPRTFFVVKIERENEKPPGHGRLSQRFLSFFANFIHFFEVKRF
jgi:hypothetical protein